MPLKLEGQPESQRSIRNMYFQKQICICIVGRCGDTNKPSLCHCLVDVGDPFVEEQRYIWDEVDRTFRWEGRPPWMKKEGICVSARVLNNKNYRLLA